VLDERRGRRGSETILLVDDEPLVRSPLERSLRDRGYTVLEAADGATALALAESRRVDLVVTDLVMPGMTGIELADALAARFPGLRTLFISGHSDNGLPPTLAGRGLLRKPFSMETLVHRVREALDA
jgi:CheY-like chemotaxis protein